MRPIIFCLVFSLVCSWAGAQTPQDRTIEVTISRGETLATIAKTYLADPSQWREIVRINRLADPNRISPGQVLAIPVRLLKEAPGEGLVSYLKGTAEIQAPGSSVWTPLALNGLVIEGSNVRTGEGSVLEIAFENGDTCLLRPQTTLGLTSVRKQGDSFFRRLFLQAGRLVTRIQKATGAGSRFEIKTPSAQCAARGTEFRTNVSKDGVTRLEVLESQVVIEAMNKRVDVPEKYGTLARTGEAPLPPRPLLAGPAPMSAPPVCRSLPFTIAFSPLSGAATLYAALTRDPAGRDVVFESPVTPGTPFRIESLADGDYYLQCRAADDLGLEGLPMAPVAVKVRTSPRPPDISTPAAALRCWKTDLPLSWPAVDGAVRYRLQRAEDPEFSRIISDVETAAPSAMLAITTLGTSFLRAASVAGDDFQGAWSAAIPLEVALPLGAPKLEKPRVSKDQVLIRWNELGPQAMYRLQVSRNSAFTELVYDSITRAAGVAIPKPTDKGRYYVRVGALDPQGGECPPSATETFTLSRGLAGLFSPCFLSVLGAFIFLII